MKMENKPGYKNTEHGWIPEEWEVKKIKEYGQVFTGNTPPTKEQSYYGNDYLFVSPEDLGKFKYIRNSKKMLSNKGFSISRQFPKDSVLVTCIGSTIGKIGIAYKELTSNQQINAIVCDKKHSPEFLYYELIRNLDIIRNLACNQAVPILNKSSFEAINIICPPLPEQKKIAEILSTWDKAIETTEKLIVAKTKLKNGLMQQLLTGKKRINGFNKNWKEYQLHDIFDRVSQKNTEKNTNVVTISAQRGFVRQEDFFNKIVASDILDDYFLVEKGDFCYNKSYSKGYDWGATKRLKDFDKAVVTTLYICFRTKNIAVSSGEFFEHFFEANILDEGLTQIAHEGGRAHGLLNVTPHDFFNLRITIPDIEEQKAIASILDGISKEIEILNKQLTAQKEQKKGLMQLLLTGKVRVRV